VVAFVLMAVKVVVPVLAAEPLAVTADVHAVKSLCASGADLLRIPLQICTRITMKCDKSWNRHYWVIADILSGYEP
jgi:hypothetical protein